MEDHIYTKSDLIYRFDGILNKKLQEIDDKGIFADVRNFKLQKGVVGTIIEQCVLGYPPNSRQEADLVVQDGSKIIKMELKSTGMVIDSSGSDHFVAKEPMSITAVGIYDLADQTFYSSFFWHKLEHMLLVYYHYSYDHAVKPYDFRNFYIKGYDFHEFNKEDELILKRDWEHVHSLIVSIISEKPGPKDKEWKEEVKNEYIDRHGELRQVLSYIDLAPKYPPRFRLKRSVVSLMIAKHFGYELEQLPGRYNEVSDIDIKCQELTVKYSGKTVAELSKIFNISYSNSKNMSEKMIIGMFGGTSTKLNKIELFVRFGLIAKTIVLSHKGGKTEDMKLFHIDFEEMVKTTIIDEDGSLKPMSFEDSMLYSYFADHEFLCAIFQEPDKDSIPDTDSNDINNENSLYRNIFLGFKRLVFSDDFIYNYVFKLWMDTRDKIMNNKLRIVFKHRKDGRFTRTRSGRIQSAPNFLKSSQNVIFIRGSAPDSSPRHMTESVNGISMLPQYVWIRGDAIINELGDLTKL